MKKIMLIDDRTLRQSKFIENTGIEIFEYSSILDNYTAESYEVLLKEFIEHNFSRLDLYDIVITHRSAFGSLNSRIISKFKEICRKENKILVFFSGGISSVSINEFPFKHMLLNSKVFYSHNLKLSLNEARNNNLNIMILAFGSNWKINLLLNTLENINKYVGENECETEVVYAEFNDETNLELIKDFISFELPKVKNDFITMRDLKLLTKNLTNQIKQQVIMNV